MFRTFKVSVIDSSAEGILGVLFTHKFSDYKSIVFSCYLPPEDSPWGRDSATFYGQLLAQIYFHNYVDCYFVCGDVNGRTGGLKDFIYDVDMVPPRVCIDDVKNKHGESFVDFLIESKLCITNGRITPELDNFTSISSKGRAVVEYIAVSQDCLYRCNMCEVQCISDIIDQYKLQGLIGSGCRPPDHSLIVIYFIVDNVADNKLDPDNSNIKKK